MGDDITRVMKIDNATCFSFRNLVSDVKYEFLIVCICKNIFFLAYITKIMLYVQRDMSA